MKDTIVETLHQPEYTGENRCEACTVVNAVIAAGIAAIVARKSKLAAAIAVGISGALIYLRGYLVPGTPTLTKRYLPPSVLRLFGKEPEPAVQSGFSGIDTADSTATGSQQPTTAGTPATESATTDAPLTESDQSPDGDEQATDEEIDVVDPETYFDEIGVLEPCAEIDDLCLTDEFEAAWSEAIEAIDTDELDGTDAAASIGLDADGDHEFEIARHDDARTLHRDEQPIGQWPSQAALVADVSAARVLDDWSEEWASIDPEQKGTLLNSLRLFLETCPTTGGAVVMGEETVESCCQSHDVVAVTCEESGERLFEHPVDGIEA